MIFQPDPFNYFFGEGIGTNLGASAVGLAIGYAWGRRRFKAIHRKLDAHHAHHVKRADEMHEKLDKLLEGKP